MRGERIRERERSGRPYTSDRTDSSILVWSGREMKCMYGREGNVIFKAVKQFAMVHHQSLYRRSYGSVLVPPTPGITQPLRSGIFWRYNKTGIILGFYPSLSWFTSSGTTIDQLIEFRVQWMGGWRCLSSACSLLLCAALMMWRDQQRAQCKLTINCTWIVYPIIIIIIIVVTMMRDIDNEKKPLHVEDHFFCYHFDWKS